MIGGEVVKRVRESEGGGEKRALTHINVNKLGQICFLINYLLQQSTL